MKNLFAVLLIILISTATFSITTLNDELTKLAKQGDKKAQYDLGVIYSKGEGVSQNYEEAFKWYKKSAQQGYKEAQYILGFMYDKGKGVKQSYQEAINWWKKSAEQGNALSQHKLIGT